ncbi:MAG: WGR domain-containing protein [Sulfuricella sp.]
MLYWEKHDYDKNRHSWYAVTFGHDLLGDLILTRSWGSLGWRSRRHRKQPVDSADDLRAWLRIIGTEREANGYAVVAVG